MKKSLLALPLAAFLLFSCGGQPTAASSEASAPASSSAPDYSAPDISYDPYVPASSSHEPGHNSEFYDYESIKVNTPEKELVDDFAFGVDLSSLAEVEANGGIYYDKEGNEADVFTILKDAGVNYARFRLWNDPYSELTDEEGHRLPYGGGTNDLATDIYLAKRAKEAGMKVLVDFHYSDHWADPAKFFAPKAWLNTTYSGNIAKVLGQYTYASLKAFKDAGVEVDSVQIGNESNNGLAGYGALDALNIIARMVHAGVDASRQVFPDIKTLVHLTNVKTPSSVYYFLDALKEEGADYDVVGLSYYPYLHGTLENLHHVMEEIVDRYHKPSWIVEASYGFTDAETPWASNAYNGANHENPGGYLTGWQGQATMMADLVSTLSKVKGQNGQGIFYWEPAWLPVRGSTWASPAGQVYNKKGVDGTKEQIAIYSEESCRSSWANQGWFSYQGRVLPSAYTYKRIVEGDKAMAEEVIGARAKTVMTTVNLLDQVKLPETALLVTNLDALRAHPVDWDKEAIASITKDDMYKVEGKILVDYETAEDGSYVYDEEDTYPYVCYVTAETNYIVDYSFEKQADGEEVEVGGDWSVTSNVEKGARIEAKGEGNLDGEKYFHWFSDADNEITLTGSVKAKQVGSYDLSTHIMAGDLPSDYEVFELWYQVEGKERVNIDILEKVVKGWGAPLDSYMARVSAENIVVEVADTTVTYGLHIKAKGSAWGHNDLWSFVLHQDAVREFPAVGGLEDGDFQNEAIGSKPVIPWYVDTCEASQFQVKTQAEFGDRHVLHFWDQGAFKIKFHQTIRDMEAGDYKLEFLIESQSNLYNSFDF